MKKTGSVRVNYFLGFVVLLFLMGFSFLLQYQGIVPCPLCLLQRMMMMALIIVCFIGIVCPFKKTGYIVLNMVGLLISLMGMLLAGRQIWLQYTPPIGQGECGVSLYYLLNILPMADVAKIVWQGGTECSEVGWVFLGLSLAAWSLLLFGSFFIFMIWQLKRSLK
jgi:protein dithiol:quinone oxidoreductase